MRFVFRKAAVLALAATASLALAGSAGANGVVSGDMTLEPDPDTFEALADMSISVDTTGRATFTGAGATFPATGGDIDPTAGYKGIVSFGGGLRFSRSTDGAAVKFKKPSVIITNKAKLFVSVKQEPLRLATLKNYELSGTDKQFQLRGGEAALSKGAAKVLKQRFDFPFRRGIPLGTVDIKAKLTKEQVQE